MFIHHSASTTSRIIQYHSVSFSIIQYHSVSFSIIQYHSVSFSIIQYHSVSFGIRYHSVSLNIIQYHPWIHHHSSSYLLFHPPVIYKLPPAFLSAILLSSRLKTWICFQQQGPLGLNFWVWMCSCLLPGPNRNDTLEPWILGTCCWVAKLG